jgi:hypothetical protein
MFTAIVKRFVFEQREVGEHGQKLEPRLVYQVVNLKDEAGSRKAVRCWLPRGSEPAPGVSMGEWAWSSVEAFEPMVRKFGRGASEEPER